MRKTTLARFYVDRHAELFVTGFDLEDPLDLAAQANSRLALLELTPFSLSETGVESKDRVWLRGGFPPAFLSSSE